MGRKAGTDYDNSARAMTAPASISTRNTAKVFSNLEAKVQKIVQEELEHRAGMMQHILTHRIAFGSGVGRYPKYDGMDAPDTATFKKTYKIKSKHSYRNWKVVNRGKNLGLTNDTPADDGFRYAKLLIRGPQTAYHWNRWTHPPTFKINAQGFSTQMPNGIYPLLKNQRSSLLRDIKGRVFKELGRKV